MKASRVPVVLSLLVGVLLPLAPASAQQRPAIADQIAKAYGLDAWGQVDAIRYTFALDGAAFKVHRSWVWEPKADRITYEGPDGAGKPVKITYTRSELATQSAFVKEQVDPGFFNDQYWLLLPFHMIWDTGPTVTDAGMHKLPLGKGSARKVVMTYPSTGGYLPGDTWELYVGKDNLIREIGFRHGGTAKPRVVAGTYANYRKAGPLVFSLDHRGKADGKAFTLLFTKVAVKMTGSDGWVEAR